MFMHEVPTDISIDTTYEAMTLCYLYLDGFSSIEDRLSQFSLDFFTSLLFLPARIFRVYPLDLVQCGKITYGERRKSTDTR